MQARPAPGRSTKGANRSVPRNKRETKTKRAKVNCHNSECCKSVKRGIDDKYECHSLIDDYVQPVSAKQGSRRTIKSSLNCKQVCKIRSAIGITKQAVPITGGESMRGDRIETYQLHSSNPADIKGGGTIQNDKTNLSARAPMQKTKV